MLRPEEFLVGSTTAAEGLTLVLPRDKYERPLLVIDRAGDGAKKAVILDEEYPFESFDLPAGHDWKGLLIPGVRIEVDEGSMIEVGGFSIVPGVLVREADALSLAVSIDPPNGFRRRAKVPLVTGLPPCANEEAVGFTRWEIVLGEGLARRTLKQFSVAVPGR